MLTKVVIVGRTNVGKSTLFNRLSNNKNAIVSDKIGLTKDRQYATIFIDDKPCQLIDTGGLTYLKNSIDNNIEHQTNIAIDEAYIVLFVVDCKNKLTSIDLAIAKNLRKTNKKIILIVNKADNVNDLGVFDFFSLGLGEPLDISSEHNRNISSLKEKLYKLLPTSTATNPLMNKATSFAVLGKPNAGKSTLVNKILNNNRVITDSKAGTTIDSIHIPFKKNNKQYVIIDTAGIRRNKSVQDKVEKISIIKALATIRLANVVLLVISASEGVSEQDASLLGIIISNYKPAIIIVNKWDSVTSYQKQQIKRQLATKLKFTQHVSVYFISALYDNIVTKLLSTIDKIYHYNSQKFSTALLNKILQSANISHKPPLVKGKRLKLKYVCQSGELPIRLVFFGNHVQTIPHAYKRFLQNIFSSKLKIHNAPIKFEFRSSENPFQNNK